VQPESALALVHVLTQPAAFTRSTFQLAMFWLNAVALLNRLAIVVTDAVFHLPMSALNVGLLAKSETMQLTALTFQSAMLPYVVVAALGVVTHAVTAVAMLLFVMHMAHVTEPTVHA
jgi:hypothetical protein